MRHYVKDLYQWEFSTKEIDKRINIIDLASYFLNVKHKGDTWSAGILDWENITNNKNIMYFNEKDNTFIYNHVKGGPSELFSFLVPKGDFFAFINKVYKINQYQFLAYVIFVGNKKIAFNNYPINLDEIFIDKENL